MTSLTAEPQSPSSIGSHTRVCPQCGATIPVNPNFTDWCDQCDWNVQPLPPLKPKNRFDKLYLSLGDRMGKSLLDQFIHAESLPSKLTLAQIAAYLIALLTHCLTLALVVAGVWVIVTGWPYIFIMALGVIVLLIAYSVRPRFMKISGSMVTREQAPSLYRLVGRIQVALHAPELDGIVIDGDYNASYELYGVRGKRILTLGLPLITAMNGQELVALIGHEMAHSVNGDPARSYIVNSAVHTLFGLYRTLRESGLFPTSDNVIYYVLSLPFRLVIVGISFVFFALAHVLVHVLWQDSQRAEYWADYLGARVSGTQASISTLRKLPLYSVFFITVQRAALNKHLKGHLFDEFRSYLATIPAREYERIYRALKFDQSRLDMTHPPTAYRLAFLEAHPCLTAEVTCSQAEYDAIYRELETREQEIQSKLIDDYLGQI